MRCPKCGHAFSPILTTEGIIIDSCENCRALWLDQGEINYYTANKKLLKQYYESGLENLRESVINCPRCLSSKLTIGQFPGKIISVEECPNCHGLYFDQGELRKLNQNPIRGKRQIKTKSRSQIIPSISQKKSFGQSSLIILGGLYGLIYILCIICVELGVITTGIAFIIPLAFLLISYLIGPWINDWSLRLFGSLNWVELDSLPNHLSLFITDLCKKNKIKIPKIGLVSDNGPNAYTYGRTPNDARIVFTNGLIQRLEKDELEAVVAHEIGHIKHWDFLFMTMAQAVPLLFYQLYRITLNSSHGKGKSKSSGKGTAQLIIVGIVAYVLYFISQYVVLYLSRIREYWADRFSGYAVENPNSLVRALIKIAYGLNIQPQDKNKEEKQNYLEKRRAMESMGISNIESAQSFMLYHYGSGLGSEVGSTLMVKEAMKWDLWNPWAFVYELSTTHPLIAKRITSLSSQANNMKIKPEYEFDLIPPESYWDEFSIDVVISFLPLILPGFYLIWSILTNSPIESLPFFSKILLLTGIGFFVKTLFSYRNNQFFPHSIASLLRYVKVSNVRGIPVVLKGKILGRGIPGYIFSEDFIFKDQTGILFLDYRQPFALFEFLFSVVKAKTYVDCEVIIQGWYRRAPVPFVEIKTLKNLEDKTFSKCYSYHAKLIVSISMILIGLIFS